MPLGATANGPRRRDTAGLDRKRTATLCSEERERRKLAWLDAFRNTARRMLVSPDPPAMRWRSTAAIRSCEAIICLTKIESYVCRVVVYVMVIEWRTTIET